METKKLLNSVSGTGVSVSYLIDQQAAEGAEVYAFMTFAGGTVTVEVSADNVNFTPIDGAQFTASQVTQFDLADGTYLRLNYVGVTNLTAFIKPKYPNHG